MVPGDLTRGWPPCPDKGNNKGRVYIGCVLVLFANGATLLRFGSDRRRRFARVQSKKMRRHSLWRNSAPREAAGRDPYRMQCATRASPRGKELCARTSAPSPSDHRIRHRSGHGERLLEVFPASRRRARQAHSSADEDRSDARTAWFFRAGLRSGISRACGGSSAWNYPLMLSVATLVAHFAGNEYDQDVGSDAGRLRPY